MNGMLQIGCDPSLPQGDKTDVYLTGSVFLRSVFAGCYLKKLNKSERSVDSSNTKTNIN